MNTSDQNSSFTELFSSFKSNIAQLVQQHYDTMYSLNYDESNENKSTDDINRNNQDKNY